MISRNLILKGRITTNDLALMDIYCAILRINESLVLDALIPEEEDSCTYIISFSMNIANIKRIEVYEKGKSLSLEVNYEKVAEYLRDGKYLEIQNHIKNPIRFSN
jgi:hypothetical protein